MEIVEDYYHRRILRRQHGCKPQQEYMVGWPAARGGRNPRDGDASLPQCRHDIGPENLRPVVVVVKGDPDQGGGIGAGRGPQRDSHGLAGARRTGNRGQRTPRALRDELVDLRTADRPGRHTGHSDLGDQDRIVSARHLSFRAGGRAGAHAGCHSDTP